KDRYQYQIMILNQIIESRAGFSRWCIGDDPAGTFGRTPLEAACGARLLIDFDAMNRWKILRALFCPVAGGTLRVCINQYGSLSPVRQPGCQIGTQCCFTRATLAIDHQNSTSLQRLNGQHGFVESHWRLATNRECFFHESMPGDKWLIIDQYSRLF